MRVLVVNKFFREGAGAETVFLATRELLRDAGHEVVDFAMAAPDNLPSPYAGAFAPERSYAPGASPVRRARDAAASIYSPAARRTLRRLVRDTRPDVAHLHNVYHQLTMSVVDELDALGVPTVMTAHDYKVVCPSYTLFTEGERCRRCVDSHPFHAVAHRCIKDSRAASLVGAVETAVARGRRSYQRLDALIAPSRFLAGLAAARVPEERIHVLPNFLPAAAGPPVPQGGREPVVVFAGRLEAVKGVEVLLAAFTDHDTSGARLVVIGDGPLAPEVARAAEASPRIEWLGRLPHAETQDRLGRAQAVAVPSIWEENCPMVVLEARRAGTPVLASGAGGLAELVEHGVDGLTCEPATAAGFADLVRRTAADAPGRAAMAAAGLERFARDHSAAAHLAGLEAVYEAARRARSRSDGLSSSAC